MTSQTYDVAGNVEDETDPRGLVTRTTYGALGRTIKTVEDYTDGTPTNSSNKTTEYTYGPAGMTSLTAVLPGGEGETTAWVYGVSTADGSAVDSNDIAAVTEWPGSTTGAASSSQEDTITVNALGDTVTSTDRNGTTHTYSYDVLGREVSDAVTTLGSGVDGSVRRIDTAYDGQGNPYLVTSYDAASGGSVVNQVERAYNGLGQLTTEWQAVSGSVNTSTTPAVQYAYTEMAGETNTSRLTSITYPNGYELDYNYSSGLNDNISRLSSLSDTTGTLETYDYLGLGTVVRRSHPETGVDLTYIKQSGESNGDAGDQYTGLDRFGRVVDQRWISTSTGSATGRFQYGYDRDGNVLYKDNLVDSAMGEVYSYDGLNQIASFARGILNSTKDGISGSPTATQSWVYDAAGNMTVVAADGTEQDRTANAQNQITSIGGATTPTYDANGNMTGDETGRQFVYDAWNRLINANDLSGAMTEVFAYDGTGRRISQAVGLITTIKYYSRDWQVLEERVANAPTARYVWSPVYVDALVLRDRDTGANGTLDERLWAEQDANWNVVALVDTTGAVVERFTYDPFGQVQVRDGAGAVKGGGTGPRVLCARSGRVNSCNRSRPGGDE